MGNKAKTRKSALRRFKISGTGKVMRRVAGGRHLRRKKSNSQLRNYRQKTEVTGKLVRRVKRLMALS